MGRVLILAAVGLAFLLGAAPSPKQGEQAEQRNAASEVENRVTAARFDRPQVARKVESAQPVQPPEHNPPCERGQDDRKSDLCAQWKAADSASNAAKWAVLSLILGVIGTLALFATLYWTRKAVHVAIEATKDADTALAIAERNANAAADLVKVSRETAQTQLRPFMSLQSTTLEIAWNQNGRKGWNVLFQWVNEGTSPAEILGIETFQQTLPQGDPASYLAEARQREPTLLNQPFVVPKGGDTATQAQFGQLYWPPIEGEIGPPVTAALNEWILVWCVVKYRNPIFGKDTIYTSSAGHTCHIGPAIIRAHTPIEPHAAMAHRVDGLTYVG